jgi:CO/xanthine dehydrogenase Mo-binding subunit/carbon monoxide dehydrogenase subunit G
MDMKFSGEFKVDPPKQEVFAVLSDPEKFAPMLPTFHSMEMKDAKTAVVRAKVGIGRIRGTASTELTLEEASAPNHARYVGKGKVMQGAYKMTAAFDLEESDGGTLVKWTGETQLVGKILSLAGGGMKGYAEKEIHKVISSLQSALSSGSKPVEKTKSDGWLGRILRGFSGDDAEVPTEIAPSAPAEIPQDLIDARATSRAKVADILGKRAKGEKLKRKEDDRLIKGKGFFVDDFSPAGLLHMSLVRSPYAHAHIVSIDVSKAEALPGVVCTMTGKEVAEISDPFIQIGDGAAQQIKDYPLAVDKVTYQGDPVVAVIADSIATAQDAAQLVEVEYDALPVLLDAETAMQDDILVHEAAETNKTFSDVYEYGDVDKAFEEADHVVKIGKLYFNRYGSTAIEPNACVATWDQRGEIDLFANTIMAIPLVFLSPALRVSMDKIRLRTFDIGGSFGNKITNYPYLGLACLASRKANGAPVKWIETRAEHMMAGGHGSERTYLNTEVALTKDGEITAIRSKHIDNIGAYPRYEPLGCAIWAQVLPASLKLRNVKIDFNQVVTNKGPCAPNRGYSRLPHIWFMERVLDICGHELGIATDEMRLRNYITEFPYETPNGCVYDSGDFPAMLTKAKELIGWDEWKKKQVEARAEGRLMGIGIGTTLDSGTNNWGQARYVNPGAPFSGNSSGATIKLDLDGTVVVTLGTFPQGQGHETTTAQVVGEVLGIDPEFIHVKTGFDTLNDSHTGQSGTYASQFAVTGLSAAHGAAVKLKGEMARLACFALEAAEEDLEFGVGEMGPEIRVTGSTSAVNYWMLSNFVNSNSGVLPDELREVTLNARYIYNPPFQVPDVEKKFGNLTLTYALQMHIAVVEVDPQTFQTKILDYSIVDDCGKVINHMIVEGQVHGATAHGIGAALVEEMPYDDEGNVIAGSFTDYAPMTISNMPELKCANHESPSPFTVLGTKGMGEGGGAPLHSICAALQDALHSEGIIIDQSHNSPMSMFDRYSGERSKPVSVESR